ncbi:sigma-54-dependent Fis family transcriptional regulator [Streptomyces monomycini]|uniref:sigma-54-dependent Fis family transcriptional regulator n=1 Tax=Streptomyces monomycini TaxID=371720 RepID=UPI00067CB18F|nr:helix-turn-helix domain-containing protein [Streptomyces monomycini]
MDFRQFPDQAVMRARERMLSRAPETSAAARGPDGRGTAGSAAAAGPPASSHPSSGAAAPGVPRPRIREAVLSSWRRCRLHAVDADHLHVPHVEQHIDWDSRLLSAAAPVLDRVEQLLADCTAGVVLADSAARVLYRRGGDTAVVRLMDRVHLAPGFSYAEEAVGTNGIGTALAERRLSTVFGAEHFAEPLQRAACAGVPVRNPLTGRQEGAVNLTCLRQDASPLMAAVVRQAAADIEERLLDRYSGKERAALDAFLAAGRRTSGPVLLVTPTLRMANTEAVRLLEPQDLRQAGALAADLLAAPAGSRRQRVDVSLSLASGADVRVRCTVIGPPDRPIGCVVGLTAGESGASATADRTPGARSGPQPSPAPLPALLPGLAGRSPSWRSASRDVVSACRQRLPTRVVGEAGVGKLALVRAAHHWVRPRNRLYVMDLTSHQHLPDLLARAEEALRDEDGTVVLQHLEAANRDLMPRLETLLTGARRNRGTGPWVVGLYTAPGQGPAPAGATPPALDSAVFPCTVAVAPLRYRPEDIRDLVPALLARHDRGGTVSCTPAAMQVLTRCDWPGNVRHLSRVLQQAARGRRQADLQPHDLAPECHSSCRRTLTPWEAAERDAIVRALHDAAGNRDVAARQLGISRATIYRKIRLYGVTVAPARAR